MDDFYIAGHKPTTPGDKDTLPTAGPSGRQERLNCCAKISDKNSHPVFDCFFLYLSPNARQAKRKILWGMKP